MINYALKFSPTVDEAFSLGSLTAGIINNSFDWIGVEAIKVYSVPTVALNDYSLTGANRYGTPGELQNAVQTLTITQDKSFTFTIDKKSEQDTMGVMAAAEALARQIREVVIPTIDIYRIAKLVAGAPTGNVKTLAVTKANAYEEFLAVQEILDDKKVPTGGRVCLATPGYYNKIKLDDAFTKKGDMATKIALNGQVGEIDGVPVIKAPTSYFPANVDFIITNAMVAPAPVKLVEYKIHDNAPGISGYLIEGRVRFDCFVLDNKKNAIGVHKSA